MRVPDPKANTTTEAYLAYKAGFLEESELKPVLYKPYLHFDGWLAYWAGLTNTYPNNGVPIGKKLFNKKEGIHGALLDNGKIETFGYPLGGVSGFIKVEPGKTYVVSGRTQWNVVGLYNADKKWIRRLAVDLVTIPDGCYWIRVGFQWPQDLDTVQVEEGDTATTYEVFKGEPEMLCDEEALVAYLAGVTNTYPEEIKDPYDVRIVGCLKHLVSARWPEPDYPVNNEEFYLSTMKPPVVTNDTPSADIELDDTVEAPFIDVKAYGDTSQTTYTGKNLADAFGGTWVKSNAENELIDGVYKITANSGVIARVVLQLGGLVEGETYTLSFYSRGVTVASDAVWTYARVREGQGSGEWISDRSVIAVSDDYVKHTITFTANSVSDQWVWFYVAADNRNTNNIEIYIKDIQLEAGSTATSYEPYVGGVPAPNPDYPQPVNVVTGRQVVGVRSKNLWGGYTAYSRDTNGVFFSTTPDGYIYGRGTATANAYSITGQLAYSEGTYISLTAGTYYLSLEEGLPTGVAIQVVRTSDSNTIRDGVGSFTLTEDTAVAVRVRVDNGVDVSGGFTVHPMLEESATKTKYEPYGADYEINLDGKNLIKNANTGSFTNAGVRWEVTEDMCRGSGTVIASPSVFAPLRYFDNTLPAGTYTFLIPEPFDYAVKIDLKDTNNQNHSVQIPAGSTSKSVTTTYDSIGYIISITMLSAGQVVDITLRNAFQLEIGSTATTYEPYHAPIELCKIGNYQDYIYRDADGDWYLHKATEKSIITAITSLYYSAGEGYIGGQVGKDSMASNSRRNGYCNILNTLQTPSNATEEGITFGASNKIIYIVLKDTRMESSTKANWDNWLSSNNVIVYYPLETATDNLITNSELISQLDALMEGGSYEGKTYIKVTATDPNLPALLKVEAGEYN